MRAEFCISFHDLTSQAAAFVLNRGNVQIHLNLQVVEHPFPELESVTVSILPQGSCSEGETPICSSGFHWQLQSLIPETCAQSFS